MSTEYKRCDICNDYIKFTDLLYDDPSSLVRCQYCYDNIGKYYTSKFIKTLNPICKDKWIQTNICRGDCSTCMTIHEKIFRRRIKLSKLS